MIKDEPSLFPYRPLPKRIKTYVTLARTSVPPIKLYQIKYDVTTNLLGQPEFCSDLWMITVMGFRRS